MQFAPRPWRCRRPGGPRSVVALLILPIWLLLAGAALAAAIDFPALTGRVVDEARLLSPAERDSLTEALAQHERATGQQVVVVTLKSLRDRPIEDYGYQLGRHWGIGDKDKNTGALFLIAPKERKVRIEVGYGLEGTLTDAASRLIIENVVLPSFRSGQFGPGIVAGTGAILKTLAGDPEARPVPAAPKTKNAIDPLGLIVLLLLLFFVLWAMARHRRAVPGGLRSSRRSGWTTGGLIGGLGSSGWGDGDGGGGGFSGGGGSFGGGGASGGW